MDGAVPACEHPGMTDSKTRHSIARRDFLAGLAAALLMPRLAAAKTGPPRFDNLVFVGVDDLNDWLSCLRGHPDARTPNMDRVAASGMLFTDCHAAAPICNPSRTATYFGLYPSTSGVYFNAQDWRSSSGLSGRPSIFHHLRKAGIGSFGLGKIHHKEFVDHTAWDGFWPDVENPRPPESFSQERFPRGLENVKGMRWGSIRPEELGGFPMADTAIRREAVDTLQRLDGRAARFALSIGFARPHLPWIVPRRFYELFDRESIRLPFVLDGDADDLPDTGRRLALGRDDHRKIVEQGKWPDAVHAYLASIAFADEQVGEVFDAYEKLAARERTVFVFWSDNGWHMGEKTAWRKLTLWREATRVPLMIVAPGLVEEGGVCQRPVSLVSLFATLCDLLGLETPTHLDAPSLLPLLRDPEAAWPHAALSVLGRHSMAIRNERWCYIRYKEGEEELYDRRRDPREFQNLASVRDDDLKASLRELMPARPALNDPDGGSEEGLEIGVDDD